MCLRVRHRPKMLLLLTLPYHATPTFAHLRVLTQHLPSTSPLRALPTARPVPRSALVTAAASTSTQLGSAHAPSGTSAALAHAMRNSIAGRGADDATEGAPPTRRACATWPYPPSPTQSRITPSASAGLLDVLCRDLLQAAMANATGGAVPRAKAASALGGGTDTHTAFISTVRPPASPCHGRRDRVCVATMMLP